MQRFAVFIDYVDRVLAESVLISAESLNFEQQRYSKFLLYMKLFQACANSSTNRASRAKSFRLMYRHTTLSRLYRPSIDATVG